MRGLVFVVTLVLMAMAILSVGCTKATPTPVAPPEKTITGNLTDINTPAEPGPDTVTVQTPQGTQVIPITGDTAFSLAGQACNIEDVAKVEAETGVQYNCTVVYNDETGASNVYVVKP